jgi:hypothetical protein
MRDSAPEVPLEYSEFRAGSSTILGPKMFPLAAGIASRHLMTTLVPEGSLRVPRLVRSRTQVHASQAWPLVLLTLSSNADLRIMLHSAHVPADFLKAARDG